MTDERLGDICLSLENYGRHDLSAAVSDEITRLRAALTARDERARQCVEVLGVKLTNPSGEPFDELSKAVQVISMNHANELMTRDEAIRVAVAAASEAIGLLVSMVACGESHSETSRRAVREAMGRPLRSGCREGAGMKCISLWQPWATLWVLSDPDEKVFETRGWHTSHRGPLLVHAAKKKDGEVRDFLKSTGVKETFWERHGITDLENELPFGAIIGVVDLIGCSRMDRMPEPSERERMWGNWEPDRFAWERANRPIMFPVPIPYRGEQMIFNVPDSIIPVEYRRLAVQG